MHTKARKISHHTRERYSMTNLNLNGRHFIDMSEKVLFDVAWSAYCKEPTR
jgi:hypothetical protein